VQAWNHSDADGSDELVCRPHDHLVEPMFAGLGVGEDRPAPEAVRRVGGRAALWLVAASSAVLAAVLLSL